MSEDWGTLQKPTDYDGLLQAGEPVEIRYTEGFISNGLLYAGTLDSVAEARAGEQATHILYNLECTDWHQILDRRKIARAYENKTIQYIIDDIIDDYLAEDGITIGEIALPDYVISAMVFNYCSITDAIKKIADKIGAIWYVDFDKKLYIKERSKEIAPWDIDNNSKYSNINIKSHRDNYRNIQYITKGRAETDLQSELQIADGEIKIFLTGYSILQAPSIWVNDVAQTVGIKGIDEGKQFYWNKGKNEIYAEASPPAGASVRVDYIGEFPVIMKIEDKTEIKNRAFTEGNSGKYENVEAKQGLTTLQALSELGIEMLRQYGIMGREVSFQTYISGLSAGQIIQVNLPEHNLKEVDMLITKVTLAEENFNNHFKYSVSAVTGEAVGGWIDFFKKITIPQEDEGVSQIADKVTIFEGFEKVWSEYERPNPFWEIYADGTYNSDGTQYPMFQPGQEVRYLEFMSSGSSFTKYRTAQYKYNDRITTTFILFDNEWNKKILRLIWWGGDGIIPPAWTSIQYTMIDNRTVDIDKNKFMILQIQRTDIKGW